MQTMLPRSHQKRNRRRSFLEVKGAMPQAEHMDTLSRLMIRAHCENKRGTVPDDLEQLNRDLRYVAGLDPTALDDFLKLADTHHVLVRVLIILQNAAVALDNARVADWCKNKLAQHRTR